MGTATTTRRRRARRALTTLCFAYLTSIIVVMASERVYWYWAGFTTESVLVLGLFYLIPTMAALWALALAPARRVHQVVLAGAVFAFVTEGVLTPIVYTDGPLPVLAALFVGWHGLIAFFGFWYLTHTDVVGRRWKRLAWRSGLFGVYWELWALVIGAGDLPTADDLDGIAPMVLDPDHFTAYVAAVVATLAIAHWLIGYVWPRGWRPGRASTVILFVIGGAYFSVAVLPAVFWAPLKLAVLMWGTWKLMRRSPAPATTPTVLDRMAGRVRLRDTAPLAVLALSAATTYGAIWPLRSHTTLMVAGYWVLVGSQVVGGVAVFVWVWRRSHTTVAPKSRELELVA